MADRGGTPPPSAPVDHGREPCPDRILDDVGGAFGMGAVGGGLWHLVKGLRNSPSGQRLRGGVEAIRREAPRLGGSFAVWGGLFSAFDCTLVFIRQKEDPWNSIGAGALTGGVIQLRSGLKAAGRSAAFGGVLLAMIEGLGIMLTKMSTPPTPRMDPRMVGVPPMDVGLAAGGMGPGQMGLPIGQRMEAQAAPGFVDGSQSSSDESQAGESWSSWFGWGKKVRVKGCKLCLWFDSEFACLAAQTWLE
eukprot:evm.model.scf_1683EXC.10 EVM.evm.TU.scf_1683EXC.10   scf_1683EXC:26534-30752(-)